MLSKINDNFYCSANRYTNGFCGTDFDDACERCTCKNYHRKYPTPEQFKEEYGFEWQDEAAVYGLVEGYGWAAMPYKAAKLRSHYEMTDFKCVHSIICACTPWGKPPADWRPE